MLPTWDRLQDLRRGTKKPTELDPEAVRAVKGVTTVEGINHNSDRIEAYRVGLQEGKRMSLLGKLAHLTDDALKFTDETGEVLDGISEKIALARQRRDVAKQKHHGYYDGIIKGVEDSVTVIDRLSNGPLPEGGKS